MVNASTIARHAASLIAKNAENLWLFSQLACKLPGMSPGLDSMIEWLRPLTLTLQGHCPSPSNALRARFPTDIGSARGSLLAVRILLGSH